MSTFEEQQYALIRTEEFLFDLLDPKKTPNVPKHIRERASRCAKNYPIVLDIFLRHAIMEIQQDEQKDTTPQV
jgi:hypothetical protein